MKLRGAERRAILAELCPRDAELIVDVGADHGHVAAITGAVATERAPHRSGRMDVPWVIADGLAPFRRVPVAIIAGMGHLTIQGILERGPRPELLIAHAQDSPHKLRVYLAAHGWRIEEERIALEGRGYAQVIKASAGEEKAKEWPLWFGPRLLEGDDPHLQAYLEHEYRWYTQVSRATREKAPAKYDEIQAPLAFLRDALTERQWL